MLSSQYAPAPKTITRSRTGCALKCDESKPSCSRCVRLGIPCPGYQKPLRWKAGASKSPPKDAAETPRSDVTVDAQPSSAYVPYQAQPAEQFVNNFYDPELLEQLTDAMNPGCMDAQGQEMDSALPLMQFPDDVLHLYPEQALGQTPDSMTQGSTDERLWTVTTMAQGQPASQALTRQEPQNQVQQNQVQNQVVEANGEMPLAHALQDYSSVLVEYYFKEVCGLMSCYDSPMNPYRTTISNMWTGSQSLYYITQSMAAACLSEVSPNFTSVGRQLRDQAMVCLSREAKIAQLETSSLLALVMLGMSLSWHDPNSLGKGQFDVLSRMVHSAEARGDAIAVADKKKEFFFYNSLVYWKMLLSFVTDVDPSTRHAQPQPAAPECMDLQEPRMPHPQTGIGIEVQELVAKVGSLVRKERKRIRSRRFISQKDIQDAQAAMMASDQLHSELCSIRLPTENDIVDAGDDMTPASHLVAIAEAYRCTGLLQLYRNFPDLLIPYIQSGSPNNQAYQTGSPDGSSQYPDDRTLADTWLTCLALHVLDLVKDIPTSSRSRSIQPLLFVSICSEMSLNRQYCPISNMQQPPVTSIAISPRFRTPLTGLDILQSRKTIISRLSAFENILAAKPIRRMLTLVKKTWTCMDEEKQDMYWMDVMMENGYETLMG
ncbi:Arginine metabolism regulation protein II [Fusarium austroafricanum]|uniref:Arginine metabolism regulation protein II n=1 Tax=Fusarium austroafricanum TaxID=2364996 RepID=A0A8H4KLE4_9HYPO|nr:Arginine metabolism regulation protein II [Fusarium austroafricanum]